jgi:oxygen-dependent protoporphyrinogen oxidase
MGMRIAVVGGGISGLSIAYKLKKEGHDVAVFEADKEIGGKIGSMSRDGFELDLGPITISETPTIVELANELGLEITPASAASSIRYIYSNGKLHRVGPGIITGSLLSISGKLSMLRYPFTAKTSVDESVASYARRRFGEQVYQRLFDPLMSGIYAGDAELLSAKSVFKKRGKRKIISFKGGVSALTKALAGRLDVVKGKTINDLNELKDFDKIVLTTPASVTAKLIPGLSFLNKIPYTSLTQIFCEVIPGEKKFDGFGFLVPSEEKMSLLGAVCVSNVFSGKAPEGKMLFVLFAHDIKAVDEFNNIVRPVSTKELYVREWRDAIPQPHVGHQNILDQIKAFEASHPNISIRGNYVTGVAVGDCL